MIFNEKFLLYVLIVLSNMAICNRAGCIGDSGRDVEWWFIYKLPASYDYAYYESGYDYSNQNELERPTTGNYDYSNGGGPEYKSLLKGKNSALERTMGQIYARRKSKSPNSQWIIYNDQAPPSGTSKDSKAHAKGIFSKSDLFWIVHSQPLFPAKITTGNNEYKFNGKPKKGQSFLCVSLAEYPDIDHVSRALRQMRVRIYDKENKGGVGWSGVFWEPLIMEKHLDADRITHEPINNGNSEYKIHRFTKPHVYKGDIFHEIAEKLSDGFYWKTYQVAGEDSWCTLRNKKAVKPVGYHAIVPYSKDIINIPEVTIDGKTFKDDHAKIGVAKRENKLEFPDGDGYWVCIGDLNRMTSQRKRGGGFVCIDAMDLWRILQTVFKIPFDIGDCNALF